MADPIPSLECICVGDPYAGHCQACNHTGQIVEWQCDDCMDWFDSHVQQPDPDVYAWNSERYCDPCAAGQKLDFCTEVLRKAWRTISPTLHAGLLEQVNAALVMAGEKPI